MAKTKTTEDIDHQAREMALVTADNQNESLFAQYAQERDKWLSTQIVQNTALAVGGYVFTVLAATQRQFEASEFDIARGIKPGELVEKVAYLCEAQQAWTFYPENEEDVIYDVGDKFIVLMNANPIRTRDLDRIIDLLRGGPIYNVCLQQYENKTKGFAPAIGLVSARQWHPL